MSPLVLKPLIQAVKRQGIHAIRNPFEPDWSLAATPGAPLIRRLQVLKFGQVIRTDGPQSHLAKTGTPTMGGAMILGAIAIATLLWADLSSRFIWFALFVTLSFGLVGFADDWLKIRHKSPKGLSAPSRRRRPP